MIYIASYKSLRKLKGFYTLAISNGIPASYYGARYKKLAPTYNWVRKLKTILSSKEGMTQEDKVSMIELYYDEVLSKYNPKDIYDELISIGDGRDVVLLTQEAYLEFSSRKIVQAWFVQQGLPCEEICD